MHSVIWMLFASATALVFDYFPETRDPPPKRLYTVLSYNENHNSLTVTGGQKDNSVTYRDIWKFNLTLSQWENLSSPTEEAPGKL